MGVIIGGNLVFQNGLDLTIKTAKNTEDNSLKQLTLTVHGIIFGRAYYQKDIYICDLGHLFEGELISGGACYQNFIVPYIV